MRILLANELGQIVGGMEMYLRWLAPELLARGHQLVCVTRYPAEELGGWAPKGAESVVLEDEQQLRRLALQCEVALTNPLGRVDFEAALAAALPTALFAHTFYGTCVSGGKMHAFPDRRPCDRLFGWKCLALYGPRRCGGANPLTALRLFRREAERAQLLRRFRRIVVASQYMATEFVRNGVDRARLDCVPLPVERPEVLPEKTLGRQILFLGRMTTVKGIDLLLDAVAHLRARGQGVDLVLAGDGAVRKVAEARARRLGLAARFRGWVDEKERAALFAQSSVLALPSTWPEPFGLVGLEAAAHGLPTVAFDVGGVREWLMPGLTGEVAPSDPPTVHGLAAALERALEPKQWTKLSAGAYENSRRFAPAAHVSSIERCLEMVRDA
jgi:glycosyltransferase involved in cell wall biosynthesis